MKAWMKSKIIRFHFIGGLLFSLGFGFLYAQTISPSLEQNPSVIKAKGQKKTSADNKAGQANNSPTPIYYPGSYGNQPFLEINPPSSSASVQGSPLIANPNMDDSSPQKRIQKVLDFWFGPLPTPQTYPEDKVALWFVGGPEMDREISSRFGEEVRQANSGQLNSWRETARGRLALILLLDQFPRYMYRNNALAYASDAMARGLVLEGLQKGEDKQLLPVERAYFYMPLQHSEDINLQNLSVQLYSQLANEAPEAIKPQMEAFLRYAILHQQTISKFKRFPNRNRVLGRPSTVEEALYMYQH